MCLSIHVFCFQQCKRACQSQQSCSHGHRRQGAINWRADRLRNFAKRQRRQREPVPRSKRERGSGPSCEFTFLCVCLSVFMCMLCCLCRPTLSPFSAMLRNPVRTVRTLRMFMQSDWPWRTWETSNWKQPKISQCLSTWGWMWRRREHSWSS